MTTRYLLKLVLALTFLFNVGQADDQVFTDQESGLKFPNKVGIFKRSSAGGSMLTGNTKIAYDWLDKNGNSAAITIYLGPRPGTLDAQMSELQQGVVMFHPSAKLLTLKKRTIGKHEGRIALFHIAGEDGGLISEGCLFRVGKQSFKLRMTGPYSDKDKLTAEVQRLLSTVLK